MSLPELIAVTDSLANLEVDDLVLGLRQGPVGPQIAAWQLDDPIAGEILASALAIEADGARDSTWRLPAPPSMAAGTIVLTGLGSSEPDEETLRQAAGAALRVLGKSERVALSLPHTSEQGAIAVAEGACIGAHRALRHGEHTPSALKEIHVHGNVSTEGIAQAKATSQAVWRVRDLVNLPPNMLTPAEFVSQIQALAHDLPISIEVLDEKKLRAEGFGGITAVGQGSQNPPRLMVMRYSPPSASRHVALVGKGITFDSGGLSLKPANSMVGMKYDMTGAAVVAAVTLAAAELGISTQVTAWVCLAENMPSGSASRPNDVITIKGGKTVEILNTDAEGRLVMADGLHAASAEHPDLIVDIATLTGAARVALGERYAGLMGSADAISQVQESAARAGELVWPMPLPEELRSLLKTDVADIANAKPGNTLGGMLLAGLFLKEFVGTSAEGHPIPWAHLDIAGPAANSSGAWGYTPQGPTGALTRTLVEVLRGAPQGSK
jgi:leucyl aminopeptidase